MKPIFEFNSYRVWLEYWFLEKKKASSQYSYRMIARICHQKSPSFFKDVISGRRHLSLEQEEILRTLMKLDKQEAQYFRDLILFEQDENEDIRQRSFERISAQRRIFESKQLEGDGYLYLSNWYYPVIRELCLRKDFRPEPEWIVEQVVPKIEIEEAIKALQTLKDLGMLTIHDDENIEVHDVSVTTPNQVAGLAVHQYHSQMLKLAEQSLHRFDEDERHLLGVTVCIPQKMVPVLKEELNRMAARLLDLCDSEESEGEVAIQLGLQLFPVSKAKE